MQEEKNTCEILRYEIFSPGDITLICIECQDMIDRFFRNRKTITLSQQLRPDEKKGLHTPSTYLHKLNYLFCSVTILLSYLV